jgi:hypothetical protein
MMTNSFRLSWVLPLVAATATLSLAQTAPQTPPPTRRVIVPGEQAPPADPGQRNFGGPAPGTRRGAPREALI